MALGMEPEDEYLGLPDNLFTRESAPNQGITVVYTPDDLNRYKYDLIALFRETGFTGSDERAFGYMQGGIERGGFLICATSSDENSGEAEQVIGMVQLEPLLGSMLEPKVKAANEELGMFLLRDSRYEEDTRRRIAQGWNLVNAPFNALFSLKVTEAYKKQGFATKMEEALLSGTSLVICEIAEDNDPSINLHTQKMGFTPTGVITSLYNGSKGQLYIREPASNGHLDLYSAIARFNPDNARTITTLSDL